MERNDILIVAVLIVGVISGLVFTFKSEASSINPTSSSVTTKMTETTAVTTKTANATTTAKATTTAVETTTVTTTTPVTTTTVTTTTVPTTTTEETTTTSSYVWDGPVLNPFDGIVSGPSGNETYYNLDMSGVISIMQSSGYDYQYWIRDDGVKMYGPYIMCAADLSIRPRGSLVETSLGTAIVCDTGGFVEWDNTRLDIATTW